MRIVLDTNVLLSGLMLPAGVPGKIMRCWRAAQFELALSNPMLEEIERALAYPKIQKRLNWSGGEITRFVLLLRFKAHIVDITGANVEVPDDPDDEPILATLIAAQAEYLVTGDQALLALRERYPIVTPGEFARNIR